MGTVAKFESNEDAAMSMDAGQSPSNMCTHMCRCRVISGDQYSFFSAFACLPNCTLLILMVLPMDCKSTTTKNRNPVYSRLAFVKLQLNKMVALSFLHQLATKLGPQDLL